VANGTFVGIDEARLWSMADALRNNMDAAEYKHVALGLIFLNLIRSSQPNRDEHSRSL
jgi:type I restriction enzyme M protein